MTRSSRRAALLIAAALASMGAAPGLDAHRVRVVGAYVNRNYGFRLTVPKGLRARRVAAPSPNHGVEIELGPGRTLEVSADFNAAGYDSLDALLDARLDAGEQAVRTHTTLAGRSAARADAAKGERREIVIVRQSGRDVDAVNTTVELDTTAGALATDTRTLDRVLASFRSFAR